MQTESLGAPLRTHGAGAALPISGRRNPGRWPAEASLRQRGSRSSVLPVFCTKSRATRAQASARHPLGAPILGAGTAAGRWQRGSGPRCSLPGGPGAYIPRSLGPKPSSWATQGSVLSPEPATCVCSWGGAEAGKRPGGGRICGCGPQIHRTPAPLHPTPQLLRIGEGPAAWASLVLPHSRSGEVVSMSTRSVPMLSHLAPEPG